MVAQVSLCVIPLLWLRVWLEISSCSCSPTSTRKNLSSNTVWMGHIIYKILEVSSVLSSLISGDFRWCRIQRCWNRGDIAVALYALPMKLVEVGMMAWNDIFNVDTANNDQTIAWKDVDGMQKTISQAFEVLFAFWLALSAYFSPVFRNRYFSLLSWEKIYWNYRARL